MAGKVWKISICMMLTVLLCACTGNDMMEKKVRDLDFTVVSAEDISCLLYTSPSQRDCS